jgi:hypothetical protein
VGHSGASQALLIVSTMFFADTDTILYLIYINTYKREGFGHTSWSGQAGCRKNKEIKKKLETKEGR